MDGVTLEAKKDGCVEVQWMEFTKVRTRFMHVNIVFNPCVLQDTVNGGRVFSKEDVPPTMIYDVGTIVPFKVGQNVGSTFTVTTSLHHNLLARLQHRTG